MKNQRQNRIALNTFQNKSSPPAMVSRGFLTNEKHLKQSNTKCLQNVLGAIGPVVLMAALLAGNMPRDALAKPAGYAFTPLAVLNDPAPGSEGGNFINDFEVGGINNRSDVVFGADLTTGGEGVFLLRKGQISQLARSGGAAPGGGFFDFSLFLGPTTLNDDGDTAFAFVLDPFSLPVGVHSGVYRRSQSTGAVMPVVVPDVTPAPGGGVFAGGHFGPILNNSGDLIFPAIIPTDKGIHLSDEPVTGLGIGIFKADKKGHISSIVGPGDFAPKGGTFDHTSGPWVNNRGDVAFSAHIAGKECRAENFQPQKVFIGCLVSLYVKKDATGEIRAIARSGETAPGGGIFRAAGSPVMNDRGDIAFMGDLTQPPRANDVVGVYLHSQGKTIRVAGPGDSMPGGGEFVTASTIFGNQIHLNNPGEVVFNAILNTDDNMDGTKDTGLFMWSRGSLHLVARTGTVIPGVGTIAHLVMTVIVFPPPESLVPNSGAINNDRGQVAFGATLEDESGVMLLATPVGDDH